MFSQLLNLNGNYEDTDKGATTSDSEPLWNNKLGLDVAPPAAEEEVAAEAVDSEGVAKELPGGDWVPPEPRLSLSEPSTPSPDGDVLSDAEEKKSLKSLSSEAVRAPSPGVSEAVVDVLLKASECDNCLCVGEKELDESQPCCADETVTASQSICVAQIALLTARLSELETRLKELEEKAVVKKGIKVEVERCGKFWRRLDNNGRVKKSDCFQEQGKWFIEL